MLSGMDALDLAIKLAGSQSELARLLNIKHPNIAMWKASGKVPYRQAVRIEKLWNGAIKAVDFYGSEND